MDELIERPALNFQYGSGNSEYPPGWTINLTDRTVTHVLQHNGNSVVGSWTIETGLAHYLNAVDRSQAALRDELAEARRERDDWRDDPATSDAWNAGCDFAMDALCKVLRVDPDAVSWDAATETLEGDVMSVVCNILTAGLGEDWLAPGSRAEAAEAAARTAREAAIREAVQYHQDKIDLLNKINASNDEYAARTGRHLQEVNVICYNMRADHEAHIRALLALLDSPPAGSKTVEGQTDDFTITRLCYVNCGLPDDQCVCLRTEAAAQKDTSGLDMEAKK